MPRGLLFLTREEAEAYPQEALGDSDGEAGMTIEGGGGDHKGEGGDKGGDKRGEEGQGG